MTDYYPEVTARFAAETKQHEMTVLLDQGLYRHLRFKDPKSSGYWFDLITVPGTLIFQGDGDSFVFRRINDMFAFFRDGIHRDGTLHINPWYWSEKLKGGGGTYLKYDQGVAERLVKEAFVDVVRSGRAPRGLGLAVREEILDSWEMSEESSARSAIERFEFKGFRFRDVWEWDLRDYHWWFLFACYSIVWGIQRYDAWKAERNAAWSQVSGYRWTRTVDGVEWTLARVDSTWVLDHPAYPDVDSMGTTDEAVARERADEQIAAWHKHHPGGGCRG